MAKKSEILKSKIFGKSIELFMERGFDNVKISDICEELGIATGLFYYYYPSKEAVLLTYSQLSDILADGYAAVLKEMKGNCADKLIIMVSKKIETFSSVGQELGNVCMQAYLKHLDSSLMDMERSAYRHFLHIIEEGQKNGEFKRELDPNMLTSSLRYVISGAALHWCCSSQPFDIEAECEVQLRSFIDMIRA